jgi:hypothetical protein
MTCRECQDLMLEVGRRRAAPSVERAVLDHTESCQDCSGRLEQERTLTAGLRALAVNVDSSTVSPELEARLMAAFATEHGAVRPWSVTARRWLPIAAAVVLCAGAAAWWLTVSLREAPATPQIARIERPRPAPEASTPAVTVSHPGEGSSLRAAPTARPDRRRARPAARPIQAVGFVPIPSAAGLPDFESGEIVRLGIPVTALPNYGLEIPSGAQAAIQADLLIGQDGQARAIRLVTATTDGPRPRQ